MLARYYRSRTTGASAVKSAFAHPIVDSHAKPSLSVNWVFLIGSAVAVSAAYLAWWSIAIEPRRLAVERYLLRLPQMPRALDNLTIAFLSDFHLLPSGFGVELAERAVLLANEANPDLVLLGAIWCIGVGRCRTFSPCYGDCGAAMGFSPFWGITTIIALGVGSALPLGVESR